MIDVDTLGAGVVMFTHIDPDTKEESTYAISLLLKAVDALVREGSLKFTYVVVDQDFARSCRKLRGIESHRLKRMTQEALNTPILMRHVHGGSTLILDGHHRYVYAAKKFRRTIKAYLLPPGITDHFLVSGLKKVGEQGLLTMPSGIL